MSATQFTLCPKCHDLASYDCFKGQYTCTCGWKESNKEHYKRLNLQERMEIPQIIEKKLR
jgi:hypothetical protein